MADWEQPTSSPNSTVDCFLEGFLQSFPLFQLTVPENCPIDRNLVRCYYSGPGCVQYMFICVCVLLLVYMWVCVCVGVYICSIVYVLVGVWELMKINRMNIKQNEIKNKYKKCKNSLKSLAEKKGGACAKKEPSRQKKETRSLSAVTSGVTAPKYFLLPVEDTTRPSLDASLATLFTSSSCIFDQRPTIKDTK